MIIIFGTLVWNGDISRFFFFLFFKILIFWVVSEVKGQKNGPKWQKIVSVPSQESYIIWLSFMVHLCEIMISLEIFFHFFKILIFWFLSGVKGEENCPKWEKNFVCRTPYLKNHTSYGFYLWYTCVKW